MDTGNVVGRVLAASGVWRMDPPARVEPIPSEHSDLMLVRGAVE
jgi:hypothetical protein